MEHARKYNLLSYQCIKNVSEENLRIIYVTEFHSNIVRCSFMKCSLVVSLSEFGVAISF